MRFIEASLEAEVILVYVVQAGKVLLVDFRIPTSPFVIVVSDDQFLLYGSPVEPPLTPNMVRSIEDHSTLPRMPYVAHSYIKQWLTLVGQTLDALRPMVPLPSTIAAYRHNRPSFLIESTPLWRKLTEAIQSSGAHEAKAMAAQSMKDLLSSELSYPEISSPRRRELLAADFGTQRIFRKYR